MNEMEGKKAFSFKCHKICGGVAEGEALISADDICFYLADPDTGNIIEKNHALEGQSVAGKILLFPSGKGSSIVQGDGLYMLNKNGTAPKAMIVQRPDTVLVTGAIIMEIPLVDRLEEGFYKRVEDRDYLKLNAEKGMITLFKK